MNHSGRANFGLQLTAFGAADNAFPMTKEDERGAALARRAQQGDYDDGATTFRCCGEQADKI